jgi:hypothetical protein
MLAFRNDRFSPSGTDGSNPLSSSRESPANLTSAPAPFELAPATKDHSILETPAECTDRRAGQRAPARSRGRPSHCCERRREAIARYRDPEFESISLQRGVRCELPLLRIASVINDRPKRRTKAARGEERGGSSTPPPLLARFTCTRNGSSGSALNFGPSSLQG